MTQHSEKLHPPKFFKYSVLTKRVFVRFANRTALQERMLIVNLHSLSIENSTQDPQCQTNVRKNSCMSSQNAIPQLLQLYL